ncbi:MAG: leucine-rich repeat domain-containing protein [Bacteroidia bacterium]
MNKKITNTKSVQIIIACLLLLFTIQQNNAQNVLLDSTELENTYSYTSIEEALQYPEKVIRLELKKKKLKQIPQEVFKFTNLQYLDLSKNKIRELPDSIAQLINLQHLILSKNELQELNPKIGDLKNLRTLEANNNELTALPIDIGKLEKLRYLDLWSNEIGRFPDEMKKLKNLKTMDLRVIMITDADQQRIQSMLPHTKIYFSPYCKCAQ